MFENVSSWGWQQWLAVLSVAGCLWAAYDAVRQRDMGFALILVGVSVNVLTAGMPGWGPALIGTTLVITGLVLRIRRPKKPAAGS